MPKQFFLTALGLAITAFAAKFAKKVTGFPRIGLPMISYPDCNNCDCQCGNAEQDDDFDADSVQQEIDSYAEDTGQTTATSNSFLAPVNLAGTYSIYQHPNLQNIPSYDLTNQNRGFFRGGKTNYDIDLWSLLNGVADDELDTEPVVRAQLDFLRLFSGYDVTSSGQQNYYQKASQPFLFSGRKQSGNDKRWFGRPQKVPYPQKLNEFNTRDKYFNPAGGINRIQVTPNPSLGGDSYLDNVLVLLAKKGTTQNLGIGELFTFNNSKNSNGQVNITGATLNQFGLNSVTGTTTTGTSITYPVTYANPTQGGALTANIRIIQTGNTENYMQYMPDIEHFQVVTGMTVGQYENLSSNTTGYFKQAYLRHIISYSVTDRQRNSVLTPPTYIDGEKDNNDIVTIQANNFVAIEGIENYETDYEVVILVRGVDPNTSKQTIKYDLSRIFGYTTTNTRTVEGSYYLNVPIQPQVNSNLTTPKTHNTLDNALSTGIYFPSYTFTPSNDYSAFTSNNPYYYLSTDDPQTPNPLGGASYLPITTHSTVGFFNGTNGQLSTNLNRVLPLNAPLQIPGGAFIAANFVATTSNPDNWYMVDSGAKANYGWPINDDPWKFYAIYSAAYYRYPNLNGVNFNDKNNIVMRSDRLPTSDCVENGIGSRTGYALHQNNNFCSYRPSGQLTDPTQGVAPALPSGAQYDTSLNPSLIGTLSCEGMVPLECYEGSGNDVVVVPSNQCDVPEDRMINGCYCLLNKTYLVEYGADARLFLEWKTRFTMSFAACRGVFAQVFQNNWINGTLYMFSFNKTATYPLNSVTDPTYNYCEDVIIFNDINNGFYYRSSPWDGNNFIGKDSPNPNPFGLIPAVLLNDYPGSGYNDKQIQFPTTIADLGPRENFISEICNSDNFNGYMIDRVRATSYQDTSDIIQLGFLSRLLNENVRQAIIPLTNPAGDNTEGKGIIQFFNSNRKGDRIDGDWAQMLSINSEWRISPFLSENYPNPDSIFFGNDNQSEPRPVFGVFFSSSTLDYSYRRNLTPGVETFSVSPSLTYQYGFPNTQEVPHYKWQIQGSESSYIFGSENNNWLTTANQNSTNNGFYTRKYQDLDFETSNEYLQTTNGTKLGILTNFDGGNTGNPDPNNDQESNNIIVGAPYHFYFGLNNGKTAIDKFIKLYIITEG